LEETQSTLTRNPRKNSVRKERRENICPRHEMRTLLKGPVSMREPRKVNTKRTPTVQKKTVAKAERMSRSWLERSLPRLLKAGKRGGRKPEKKHKLEENKHDEAVHPEQ